MPYKIKQTATILLLCLGATLHANAITLDDITVWAGSGDNRAGLVIDWADGKLPVVYGYRFDGSATGQDMFDTLFAQQPELFAKVEQFSFGQAVLGIGIDRDSDGFSVSDGVNTILDSDFTDGLLQTPTTEADGDTAVDADDSYLEGWATAFWGYYVSDGASDWGFASSGMTDRVLVDGDWDGFAYAPGFSGGPPSVDVPEPSSAALLVLAGAALLRRRRA